ncbi:MAG: hypothetical protein J2P43_04585 [Candidatus Dormibacteraeota bacterium]|nr:hypothetical protein [Candidatus Dormibacteraeota bacterium]
MSEAVGQVTFAAIAPHGAMAIASSGRDEDAAEARATQLALLELSGRLRTSGAESVVLFTPHNVHVEGTFAVIDAARLQGGLGDWGADAVELAAPVDRPLVQRIRAEAVANGIPMLTVSYGANDPSAATHPMDWATLVPLWYLGGRGDDPLPVAVVVPARDRPPAEHVRLGEVIAGAVRASGRRVAVVASCDHGHGHQADGPYGFRPESAVFDGEVQRLLREDRLDKLVELDPDLVRAAAADSWWQMLMLQGALGGAWKPELLSYEHPTYFGMMVAGFAPRAG